MRELTQIDRVTIKAVQFSELSKRIPGWAAYLLVTCVVIAIELTHIYFLGGVPAEIPRNQFLAFYLLIVLSALFLNRRTGLWVTVLSALAASVTKGPIPNSIALRIDLLPVATFLTTGFVITVLVESLNHLFARYKDMAHRNEVLIRDLNHRVKNHLGSIAGLVMLSRKKVVDETAKDALDTVASRLTVLARLYDRLELDTSNAAVSVRLPDFIDSLCADLEHGIVGEREIAIASSVAPVAISADKAVPIGLLVNELITNALKHAFRDNQGVITVEFEQSNPGYLLKVCDDGIGGDTTRNGTGMRLVNMLTKQLGGSCEVTTDGGRSCAIELPASLVAA